MKQAILAFGCILLILTAGVGALPAGQIEGVAFDPTVTVQNVDLKLHGMALLRYLVFIKAYVGAFYMPPGTDPKEALEAVPKRLELSYFQAISAGDFAKATRQKIIDNAGPQEVPRLSERIEQLGRLYRDVRPGDRYALTYVPGNGTQLTLNDQLLGTIAGDDFAEAVFAIWLGKNPIDRKFRDSLLGRI